MKPYKTQHLGRAHCAGRSPVPGCQWTATWRWWLPLHTWTQELQCKHAAASRISVDGKTDDTECLRLRHCYLRHRGLSHSSNHHAHQWTLTVVGPEGWTHHHHHHPPHAFLDLSEPQERPALSASSSSCPHAGGRLHGGLTPLQHINTFKANTAITVSTRMSLVFVDHVIAYRPSETSRLLHWSARAVATRYFTRRQCRDTFSQNTKWHSCVSTRSRQGDDGVLIALGTIEHNYRMIHSHGYSRNARSVNQPDSIYRNSRHL